MNGEKSPQKSGDLLLSSSSEKKEVILPRQEVELLTQEVLLQQGYLQVTLDFCEAVSLQPLDLCGHRTSTSLNTHARTRTCTNTHTHTHSFVTGCSANQNRAAMCKHNSENGEALLRWIPRDHQEIQKHKDYSLLTTKAL